MTIDSLLARAMVDPFVERVLQQVLDQLATQGAHAGYGGKPPEELVAIALGNWLSTMLAAGRPPAPGEKPPPAEPPAPPPAADELREQNSALAAAVGACDCWGERPDCRFCEGEGSPGWVRPDRQLFATYVYPALRAMKAAGGPRTAARHQANGSHGRENGDG